MIENKIFTTLDTNRLALYFSPRNMLVSNVRRCRPGATTMLLVVLLCSFGTGCAISANDVSGGFQQSDGIRLIYEYVLWRNLGQVVVLDAVGRGAKQSVQ